MKQYNKICCGQIKIKKNSYENSSIFMNEWDENYSCYCWTPEEVTNAIKNLIEGVLSQKKQLGFHSVYVPIQSF